MAMLYAIGQQLVHPVRVREKELPAGLGGMVDRVRIVR